VTAAVTVLVAAGLVAALGYGAASGFDALEVVVLAVAGALGALGIAVARRANSGRTTPARCGECGGLVSPSAPYCKHCGAPRRP
jgi:hypothetical protein